MNFDHGRAGIRLLLLSGLMVFGLVAGRATPSDAEPVHPRHEVEAAFLAHFARYVTWPDAAFRTPREPFVIGVLGDDHVAADLQRILPRQKPVHGRTIALARSHTAQDLTHCHIVFIGAVESTRVPQHLAAFARVGSRALTVGETEDFLEAGGAIRFVVEGSKVRFEINVRAADQAGLTISSKLLNLARNIRGRSMGGGGWVRIPLLAANVHLTVAAEHQP